MATYATIEDALDRIPGLVIDDEDGFELLLQRAERDIDSILGSWTIDITTGLKFDPTTLSDGDARALMAATCAQAEYRLIMGEDFFLLPRPSRIEGPDFTIEGERPYIGPRVWIELGYAPSLILADTSDWPIGRIPSFQRTGWATRW